MFYFFRQLFWRGNIGKEDWIQLLKNTKAGGSSQRVTWPRSSALMWWVAVTFDRQVVVLQHFL